MLSTRCEGVGRDTLQLRNETFSVVAILRKQGARHLARKLPHLADDVGTTPYRRRFGKVESPGKTMWGSWVVRTLADR
jgi:hypothetical protein